MICMTEEQFQALKAQASNSSLDINISALKLESRIEERLYKELYELEEEPQENN